MRQNNVCILYNQNLKFCVKKPPRRTQLSQTQYGKSEKRYSGSEFCVCLTSDYYLKELRHSLMDHTTNSRSYQCKGFLLSDSEPERRVYWSNNNTQHASGPPPPVRQSTLINRRGDQGYFFLCCLDVRLSSDGQLEPANSVMLKPLKKQHVTFVIPPTSS